MKPAQLHQEPPLWAEDNEAGVENPEGEMTSRAKPSQQEEDKTSEENEGNTDASDPSEKAR